MKDELLDSLAYWKRATVVAQKCVKDLHDTIEHLERNHKAHVIGLESQVCMWKERALQAEATLREFNE